LYTQTALQLTGATESVDLIPASRLGQALNIKCKTHSG
jgi:hypothetical protein